MLLPKEECDESKTERLWLDDPLTDTHRALTVDEMHRRYASVGGAITPYLMPEYGFKRYVAAQEKERWRIGRTHASSTHLFNLGLVDFGLGAVPSRLLYAEWSGGTDPLTAEVRPACDKIGDFSQSRKLMAQMVSSAN